MENKKGAYQNNQNISSNNEISANESLSKHSHQHNIPPNHFRLLQYGLKIPNHQHPLPPSYPNQQVSSPIHLHKHQHVQYQQTTPHRHRPGSPDDPVNIQQQQIPQKPYQHQHQKSPNSLYPPHNPMSQNTPQIWMPHQPPVHYHQHQQHQQLQQHQQQQQQQQNQQHQQKAESQKHFSPPQLQPKAKDALERKKSSGNTQLKSPSAKRPLEAPVTIQGWLHKQGSEGLMLWKKRWFVLSEYCLFYYKGPEEEKLLGSILLPSYKVSICKSEDKVNRKFAFKCEHANMRTYILAADSQESMLQWVRLLNLACTLQTNVENDQQSGTSVPSSYNQATENSDSGFHQQRNTPVHTHTSSNATDLSNPSQQELSQYNQPLYANAPPKPRRLNDGGYSSPSPDVLDRYSNSINQYYLTPIQAARNMTKSPVNIYGQSIINSQSAQPEYVQLIHRPKLNVHEYNMYNTSSIHQNVERRTPDTYGRSKLNPVKTRQQTDYEDIYAEQSMYKRPLSPIGYAQPKKMNPPISPTVNLGYRAYTPVNMPGPKDMVHYPPPQMRKSPSTIARPHSADFLEYEVQHRTNDSIAKQQPRPKSSLDINRNRSDNDYFYSQERYAEKMRKSAQYLPKMPNRYPTTMNDQAIQSPPVRYQEQEQLMPRCTTQSHFNMESQRIVQPVRSRSVLSEGSLSKEFDMDLRCSPRGHEDRRVVSPTICQRPENIYGYADGMPHREYDAFTRSASARLAQPGTHVEHPQEMLSLPRDGDRKREESMKRLLEWKQRMLQSPLNRKAQNTRYSQGRQDYYYKNTRSNYGQRMQEPQDGRKSVNNLPQYNSYSSDDEENVDGSEENSRTQAGRTLDNLPSKSESLTPAPTSSITVLNTAKEPEEAKVANLSSDDKSADDKTPEENKLTEPLKQLNKESSNLAYVSSLKSEYSKFEQSPVVSEIKSNGALVKSILAEFEKMATTEKSVVAEKTLAAEKITTAEKGPRGENVCETPTRDIDSVIEENYMTMTPKKSVLGPRSNTNSEATIIFNESEENPYVEMNQNLDVSILATPTNEMEMTDNQPYEIVCFNDNHEPLYMELKYPEKANLCNEGKNKSELPDIVMGPKRESKSTKSDSSDADDEASKDLDSLDTPSHPRFSLSDTFRPASYYLGASQTLPEFQDSSDSELVSPPPIPTSPPPMDDLDNTDECVSSIQELSSIEQPKNDYKTRRDQYESTAKITESVNGIENKKRSLLSLTSLKDQDSSSVGSINMEMERRFSSRLSYNSDSYAELRISTSRNSDYERMLKRRPVSEEVFGYIDSVKEDEVYNRSLRSSEQHRNHDYENVRISQLHTDSLNLSTGDIICAVSPDDFLQQRRPESVASISAEICALMQNSNISTPSIRITSAMSVQEMSSSSYFGDRNKSNNSSFNQSAPYYYSDLSMNTSLTDSTSTILTLNNQRGTCNGANKRDISHIVNPIKCNSHLRNGVDSPHRNVIDNTFKLAAEARSASVDFLNLTDKSGHIDEKNIYESDTLKRLKISDSLADIQSDPASKNLFPAKNREKFPTETKEPLQRAQSLEGLLLLENVLNENIGQQSTQQSRDQETLMNTSEGSYLWEEDSVWRERLRSASQRHTKSMDDLDSICESKKPQKKSPRAITRGVTYVNDNIYNMPLQDMHQKDLDIKIESDESTSDKKDSFILDREKLRQWDLLSSAPSDDQLSTLPVTQVPNVANTGVDTGEGSSCEPCEIDTTQNSASGSISVNASDTFPRTVSTKRMWAPNTPSNLQSRSTLNLSRVYDDNRHLQQGYLLNKRASQQELNQEQSSNIYSSSKDVSQLNDKMKVSAGELLGRTHEELVLLLIQLRRQSANTLQAIENYYNEIDTLQAQLHAMDQAKRLENLQKLEQIKQHLIELEKQYEKGKPLVNLVDNMVKLGSLYRSPSDRMNINSYIRDRLEFNQKIQERRLLAEERRDWNRLNSNQLQLQEKVQQLYQLDRLIQEESGTLQTLQQDKEDIERALGGLRMRLNKGFNDPAEIEHARKQQIMLENELSRVHLMLAQNSKKLEETVAGNARLEQELLVLKQKLQISRQQRSSPQFSNAGDSLPCVVGSSAMLESDFQRVQQSVGDFQKQRQELSMQVRQLTDRSNNLQHSSKSSSSTQCKKKINSLWRETDLDTMNTVDHGDLDNQTNTTPLYINTDIKSSPETEFYNRSLKSSDSTSDDTHSNSVPNEKQEIKTVRIVKRESERRQRDREKVTTGKWDALLEEDDSSQNSSVLFRPTPVQKTQSSTSVFDTDKSSGILSRQSSLSSPSLPQSIPDKRSIDEKSPELSPIFQSEAARQIITEVSIQETPKQVNRRAVPKEKRRHYTAPHNNLIMKSLNQLPTDDNMFDKVILNNRRARDDLDMERALRQRIDAPDVVRSTLSNKELKYNENTIDNILGTPNKISIPERYIPEQLPQLSAEEQEHRLRKVESIKKMLSDTAIISTSTTNLAEDKTAEKTVNSITNKATSKMIEEKKQREHLLQLNQILAKQVMEMSKIVAVKALQKLPLETQDMYVDEEDSSPVIPLPLYQQRDNFFS